MTAALDCSRLLDLACEEPDYSPDYNPVCEAEEGHYCAHGYIAGCGECSPPRETTERTSKTHAMEVIAEAVQQLREAQRRRSPRNHAAAVAALDLPDYSDDSDGDDAL